MIDAPSVAWGAISPELIMLGAAAVALLVAAVLRGRQAQDAAFALGLGGFAAALIATLIVADDEPRLVLGDALAVDRTAAVARLIVIGAGLLTVLVAVGWRRMRDRPLELVSLLLVAVPGMSFLAMSQSFVSLFVSLELFSVTLYALCAFETRSKRSLESGLKYLILGSVGSALLLYGAALLYGGTGHLDFAGIVASLSGADSTAGDTIVRAGAALVLVGLGFKVAVVPFHMWTPDVYEGAPTPITGFMAAATKAAAFVALFRVAVEVLGAEIDVWRPAIVVAAIVTMIYGNVAALAQRSVKRMLAYSSIAHAGYLLVAVSAASQDALRALLFYLAVYAAMTIGAFAVVAIRERETDSPVTVDSLRGFGFARPVPAIALVVFLFSLAGFPPTGGFFAKVFLFRAAVEADQTYLAAILAVTTVISLGYYLRIGLAVFDRDRESHAAAGATPGLVAATVAALVGVAVVLWLGLAPGSLLDTLDAATLAISR